jgi:hypothetical protein
LETLRADGELEEKIIGGEEGEDDVLAAYNREEQDPASVDGPDVLPSSGLSSATGQGESRHYKRWTDEELKRLEHLFEDPSKPRDVLYEELRQQLPGRTVDACVHRGRRYIPFSNDATCEHIGWQVKTRQ